MRQNTILAALVVALLGACVPGSTDAGMSDAGSGDPDIADGGVEDHPCSPTDWAQEPVFTCEGYAADEVVEGPLDVSSAAAVAALEGIKCVDGNLRVVLFFGDRVSLPDLEVIAGDLDITGNADLEVLQMPALRTLNEQLKIDGNASLPSLQGLCNLEAFAIPEFAGLEVYDSDNPALRDLRGLEKLPSLGTILIEGQSGLRSLEGLNITTDSGPMLRLELRDNSGLEDLAGLENLEQITRITMERNSALTDLTGLVGLRTIGQELTLLDNDALVDVETLRGVDEYAYGDILISGNDLLSQCDVDDLFAYFEGLGYEGTVDLSDNGPCN